MKEFVMKHKYLCGFIALVILGVLMYFGAEV